MLRTKMDTFYSLVGSGKNLDNISDYITGIKSAIELIPTPIVDQVIDCLHEARMMGQQIFIMGNGGSAATASHFVCDLAKSTRKSGWPSFRVIGLTDNMPIFSAYANDEGYENVFVQQLASLVHRNDIVIAISASGNSPNVVKAMELANKVNAITIAFTGFDGGKLGSAADIHLNISSHDVRQIEDVHMVLVHLISAALCKLAEPLEFLQTELPRSDHGATGISKKDTQCLPEVSIDVPNANLMDQLNSISKEFADHINLHDMLTRILLLTTSAVGAKSGSILVLDETGEQVVDSAVVYSGNIKTGTMEEFHELVNHGLAGWVVENRQAALIADTSGDERWLPRNWDEQSVDARSAVSVPLMSHERVVGVVTLVRPQANCFSLQDLALLTAISVTLSYSMVETGHYMR